MSKASRVVRTENQAVVFDYKPREFHQTISGEAIDFIERVEVGASDFKINEFIASKSGVSDRIRAALEDKVEVLALERLKEVQEKAYQEAYDLGFKEGTERAFKEKTATIENDLGEMKVLLESVENERKKLAVRHEAHLIQLAYLVARKIACREVEQHPEMIASLIQEIIEQEHFEEEVLVRVASQDFDFIEQLKSRAGREWESMRKIKLEADVQLSRGSCVVESNFGVIDATIDKRLERSWKALEEKLPKGHGLDPNEG